MGVVLLHTYIQCIYSHRCELVSLVRLPILNAIFEAVHLFIWLLLAGVVRNPVKGNTVKSVSNWKVNIDKKTLFLTYFCG